MTAKRRGAPRNEEARIAILQATANQFWTRHYERLSLEGIAADAGVSKQTIYRWWPSKGALIAECLIEGVLIPDRFVPVDSGDLRVDLVAWLSTLFEFAADERHDALIRSLVAAGAENADVGRRLSESVGAAPSLVARLHAAIAVSQLRRDAPVEEIVDALIGAFIVRVLTRRQTEPESAARIVDAVLGPAASVETAAAMG